MDTKPINDTPISNAARIMGKKGGSQTLKEYGKMHFREMRKKSSANSKKQKGIKKLDKRS
jgi:hypothetical protein